MLRRSVDFIGPASAFRHVYLLDDYLTVLLQMLQTRSNAMQSILARQTRGTDALLLPRLGTELESACQAAPDLQISSHCHLRAGRRRICRSVKC
jgi:hypothetical protein